MRHDNDNEVVQALTKREQQRCDALVADDVGALDDLLSEDLVHVHATGAVQSKEELLRYVAEVIDFRSVERGDLFIRPLGSDVAVMTGPMKNTLLRRSGGEPIAVSSFVTQVWQRTGGEWRIVSFHAVRAAE